MRSSAVESSVWDVRCSMWVVLVPYDLWEFRRAVSREFRRVVRWLVCCGYGMRLRKLCEMHVF